MNKTIRISPVLLAAILVLVSCSKQEILNNNYSDSCGKVRTISVLFQYNTTKTGLDGLQPKFKANDEIKLSNGTDAPEVCTVSVDGSGNATITTNLDGDLTAVYPASAARMNGNAIEGVLVPTVQNGTFASANICMAEIAEGAAEAVFENQTAVFKLYAPAKVDASGVDYVVKSVVIESTGDNDIADGSKEITVGDGTYSVADTDGACYVSLLPGETADNIAVRAGEGQRNLTGTDEVGKNKMYSVELPVHNGHEYVEFTLTVGETTKAYKWATCNVGASSSHDLGKYFALGDVVGQTWIEGTGWSNGGFYDAPDVGSVSFLPIEYDAARANWGGNWRIPDKDEYQALIDCGGTVDGYNMTVIQDNHSLFFPATGEGIKDAYNNKDSEMAYWSSTLNSEGGSGILLAYIFGRVYHMGGVSTSREHGIQVRAVAD